MENTMISETYLCGDCDNEITLKESEQFGRCYNCEYNPNGPHPSYYREHSEDFYDN